MNFAIAAAQVRKTPTAFLRSECARALGAFFVGYKSADASASIVLRQLVNEFDGPDQADACTRAYLVSRDSVTAFRLVMDAVERVLHRTGVPSPAPGPLAAGSVVAAVKDAILQGRPAMVLAEPTVVWMHDYFRGFLVGLRAVRPTAASFQTGRLMAFDSWIRASYGGHSAPWYAVIRVHEGMCERGLKRFVELWAEFEQECPEVDN